MRLVVVVGFNVSMRHEAMVPVILNVVHVLGR
jgi:hypothetical protein